MGKPRSSLVTRTEELTPTPRELPLTPPAEPPLPVHLRERRPAERIRDALLRWLEEEL
jgi:hypothetical protein